MSRQIDWSQPVTGADRKWAEQFEGSHSQLLQANDSEHAAAEVEAEDVGDVPDYTKLKKPELVAEIERRNKEYQLNLSTEGTAADLVARLQQDDLNAE